jgi:hypothetical protein
MGRGYASYQLSNPTWVLQTTHPYVSVFKLPTRECYKLLTSTWVSVANYPAVHGRAHEAGHISPSPEG